MCIVIDTNCFSCVFSPENAHHKSFKPVLQWIVEGEGKIVYGGSKYRRELQSHTRVLRLFAHFSRMRKIVEVDAAKVDKWQAAVEKQIDPSKHNDPHLVAIVAISKCRVVCTQDKRSFSLLKEKKCYPKDVERPAIYSSEKNADLLTQKYIADICRPCQPLRNVDRRKLVGAIDTAS